MIWRRWAGRLRKRENAAEISPTPPRNSIYDYFRFGGRYIYFRYKAMSDCVGIKSK